MIFNWSQNSVEIKATGIISVWWIQQGLKSNGACEGEGYISMTGGRAASTYCWPMPTKQQQHNSSPSANGGEGPASAPARQTNKQSCQHRQALYNTDPEQQRNVFWAAPATHRNSCWRNYRAATLGRQQQLGHSNKQLRQLGTQQIQTQGWLQKPRKLWQFFSFNDGGGLLPPKWYFLLWIQWKWKKGPGTIRQGWAGYCFTISG